MIRKFDQFGNVVEFESSKAAIPGGQVVDIPQLQSEKVQRYEGEWKPGKNQPTSTTDKTGPYAGIVRYLPIPESQIQR